MHNIFKNVLKRDGIHEAIKQMKCVFSHVNDFSFKSIQKSKSKEPNIWEAIISVNSAIKIALL